MTGELLKDCDGYPLHPHELGIDKYPPVTTNGRFFIGDENVPSGTGSPHVTRARVSASSPVTAEAAFSRWNMFPTAVQGQAFAALANRRDVQNNAPTGKGKSYPPLAITKMRAELNLGPTLAIVPLIALGDDQDSRAERLGLYSATWNSKTKRPVKREIVDRLRANDLDIVFTTPESLAGHFGDLTAGIFGLAWIDEDHVALTAKHFREAWSQCGAILSRVEPRVIYGCTATCRVSKQEQIIRACGLRDPLIIRIPPHRPELTYEHIERDVSAVCDVLRKHQKDRVLIYVATRKLSDEMFSQLEAYGYKCGRYHGGLSAKARAEVQVRFGQRQINIVIGTDAFGLGIDLPDIRAVVLFDPASDVSAFVQQAGRAGRDGKPSKVYLCSRCAEDGWTSRGYLVESSFPDIEKVRHVWTSLKSHAYPLHPLRIIQSTGLKSFEVQGCFHWLVHNSLAVKLQDPQDRRRHVYRATGNFEAASWADHARDTSEARADLDELQRLWQLPAAEIPKAIIEAFER